MPVKSLADCQAACNTVADSWDCINNTCTDPGTGNGAYSTLADCQAACDSTTTGIPEQSHPFKLYPNPAKEYIKIDLGDSFSDIQVVVETLNGQEVLFYTSYSYSQTHTVNIKDIAPGIYFLRLFSRDKNEVMRFIKL